MMHMIQELLSLTTSAVHHYKRWADHPPQSVIDDYALMLQILQKQVKEIVHGCEPPSDDKSAK